MGKEITTKELRKPKTTLSSEVRIFSAFSTVVAFWTPGPIFFLIQVMMAFLLVKKYEGESCLSRNTNQFLIIKEIENLKHKLRQANRKTHLIAVRSY